MYRKTCLFLFILILYGCPKEDFSDNCINYTFNTNGFYFYPESDTINLGDTLWMTYSEPLNPVPIGETDTLDIRGYNYYNYLDFVEFPNDTISDKFKVIDKFNILTLVGNNYYDSSFKHIKYFSGIEYDGRFVSRIAIIPLKKGNFLIATSTSMGNKDIIMKNNRCYKYYFLTQIANSNKHTESFKSKFGDIGINDYYIDNVYCFTVY